MANHVSSSYRAQPQKLCILLLLLFTLVSHLQVVDGKKASPKKKTKDGKKGFVNVAKKNEKKKDWKKKGKNKKEPKIELIPGTEDKEIIEYEYDLEIPGELLGEKTIMDQFQKTYNSMHTHMVVLSAEMLALVPVDVDPEAGSRNLRNLRRSFSRISMRARASGKNVGARRPLFRSSNKRNRILTLEAPDEEETFLKQFANNVQSNKGISAKPVDEDIYAKLVHIAPSDKTPREAFFSFRAKMVLKGASERFVGDVKKEIMKDFQIAYNDMFWDSDEQKSLVVEIKKMKQKPVTRKNNNTDVVCRFYGTMYTNYEGVIVKEDFTSFNFSSNTTIGNYKVINHKIYLKLLENFDGLLIQSSHAGLLEGLNGGP